MRKGSKASEGLCQCSNHLGLKQEAEAFNVQAALKQQVKLV